jgi:uncharacterized protein with HEPN domain
MLPSDLVRLRHMLDAAREALAFGTGRTSDDLTRDRVLTLALVKCIEIIGEAAAKVSTQTRASTPQIPWSDIIGMRNRLIHAYFDVDVAFPTRSPTTFHP